MAIGIRFCARQQLERRISDSELDGACHAIEFSVDLTTPLSHEALQGTIDVRELTQRAA